MEKFNEMLVPQRSKTRYENVYREYELWCSERKKDPLVEESACLYLHESKKTRKATTLCSYYSAIKNQLLVHHGVNANNWTRTVAFLKRAGEDETKKKAKVFTREEIETFLGFNSERICVREKLAFLFGVFGALRAEELSALKFEDVTMVDDETLKITIKSSKTDKAGRGFEFFAVSMPAANVVAMYAEYKSCVNDPSPDSRLFRKETQSGYGSAVLGRQHFYALPKRIATELGLPAATLYTGHSIRRTAATWLADKGYTTLQMQKFGRRKSASVAEGYVDESEASKREFAVAVCQDNRAIKGLKKDISGECKLMFANCVFNQPNFYTNSDNVQ